MLQVYTLVPSSDQGEGLELISGHVESVAAVTSQTTWILNHSAN